MVQTDKIQSCWSAIELHRLSSVSLCVFHRCSLAQKGLTLSSWSLRLYQSNMLNRDARMEKPHLLHQLVPRLLCLLWIIITTPNPGWLAPPLLSSFSRLCPLHPPPPTPPTPPSFEITCSIIVSIHFVPLPFLHVLSSLLLDHVFNLQLYGLDCFLRTSELLEF